MKLLKIGLVIFVFLGHLISCSDDNEINDLGIALEYKEIRDVPYGESSFQKYDIFLPENRTLETKVIILVHGGSWKSGDKADMESFTAYLKDQLPDMAFVNMNYRLADHNNAPYPMQIDDITEVVHSLNDKREEYQIGRELAFVGASAGAHLSLLWSYAFDTEDQVNMVCSVVGPTNFLDDNYLDSMNEGIQKLLQVFGNDVDIDLLTEVSPLHQAKRTSPATILFYGGQDPLVPNSQGTDLSLKLQALGVPQQFTLYPDQGHGWLGVELLDTMIKLQAFIEKHH